jgi:hypothetical protein
MLKPSAGAADALAELEVMIGRLDGHTRMYQSVGPLRYKLRWVQPGAGGEGGELMCIRSEYGGNVADDYDLTVLAYECAQLQNTGEKLSLSVAVSCQGLSERWDWSPYWRWPRSRTATVR